MIGDLYVRFNRDGCTAVLHHNLVAKFRLPDDILDRTVYVPKGFRTDFASIPKVARSLVPQLGPWTGAAVVHDALYWVGPSWGFTKEDADTAFNILMKEAGVKAWRRNIIYRAVKYFGHMAWNAHRKAGHNAGNMTNG